LQRLREAAEKAKIELSSVMETEINLPYITADASGPKHMVTKLTRAKFEQLTNDLVARLRGPFQAALKDAGLTTAHINEVVLVGGATRMPMVQELVRSMTNKEPHKGVNPDEVVAIGAAIQAGVLGGDVKDVLLLDVTPLSLGVETLGSVMTTLIERNTTIPVKKTETFSTADDNQTAVDIHILQGERPVAGDNISLGRFRLEGIPSAPRGMPQVEVTFDIDANGILNVTASDKATGKEQKVTITASTTLKRMKSAKVRESQEHESEDRQRKALIEARNNADGLAYQTEKTLRELDSKVSPTERQDIESKIKALHDTAASDDIGQIKRQMEDVQNAFHALSQQLYAQQEQASPSAAGGNGNGKHATDDEGEVVEGEFRDA
jgi:molecular chaperone DnaK